MKKSLYSVILATVILGLFFFLSNGSNGNEDEKGDNIKNGTISGIEKAKTITYEFFNEHLNKNKDNSEVDSNGIVDVLISKQNIEEVEKKQEEKVEQEHKSNKEEQKEIETEIETETETETNEEYVKNKEIESRGVSKGLENTLERKTISLKSSIQNVQPMTGIALWHTSWNDSRIKTDSQYIQLEFAYVTYRDVVKEEGVYDWSYIDNILQKIAERQHQCIFRLYLVYPGEETGVPDFIKRRNDYKEYNGVSYGKVTSFPDWSNNKLKELIKEFYVKFANRYDKDPRIAFLEVGFGLWGEYHISDGPLIPGKTYPTDDYQRDFFVHLKQNFKELNWLVSLDSVEGKNGPFESYPDLLDYDFGIFDDSLMHEEHFETNRKKWEKITYEERVKNSPNGGELSYYSTYDQKNALNSSGIHGRTYEEFTELYNLTFVIANEQPKYQSKERIKAISMHNGYKFKINNFEASKSVSMIEVENIGVAPIYYNAYVTINGVRSDKSLKGLMPGECEIYYVKSGGNNPILTITSDRLVKGQKIEYEADIE